MKPVSSKLPYGYICQLVMDVLPTTFCTITKNFYGVFTSSIEYIFSRMVIKQIEARYPSYKEQLLKVI